MAMLNTLNFSFHNNWTAPDLRTLNDSLNHLQEIKESKLEASITSASYPSQGYNVQQRLQSCCQTIKGRRCLVHRCAINVPDGAWPQWQVDVLARWQTTRHQDDTTLELEVMNKRNGPCGKTRGTACWNLWHYTGRNTNYFHTVSSSRFKANGKLMGSDNTDDQSRLLNLQVYSPTHRSQSELTLNLPDNQWWKMSLSALLCKAGITAETAIHTRLFDVCLGETLRLENLLNHSFSERKGLSRWNGDVISSAMHTVKCILPYRSRQWRRINSFRRQFMEEEVSGNRVQSESNFHPKTSSPSNIKFQEFGQSESYGYSETF